MGEGGESRRRTGRRTWLFGMAAAPVAAVAFGLCYFLCVATPCVDAWDEAGHEAVGMTAMSALTNEVKASVKRLLKNRDIVDVSNWAIKVNEAYPDTIPIHFQYQADENPAVLDLRQCDDGLCLMNGINHFYAKLSGAADVPPMEYPHGLKFTDLDAFQYLIALIGDMHQPLHFGNMRDNAGRDIIVHFRDNEGTNKTDLFDLWDRAIIQKTIKEKSHFWHGGWTHVNFIPKHQVEQEKRAWESETNKTAIFEKWALESLDAVHTKVYLQGTMKSGHEVTQADALLHFQYIRNRLLLAGLRLAIVVNSVFESRDLTKLRQGSALVPEAMQRRLKEPGRVRQMMASPSGWLPQNWMRNLAINVSVVCIVLFLMCKVSRSFSSISTSYGSIAHGSGPAVIAAAKAKGADKSS